MRYLYAVFVIKHPPFFDKKTSFELEDIKNARILALLGDSVTTDHISPAGSIKEESPAGSYLLDRQINFNNFNSYGSRRGNHEIMMRGTFANIRIKNEILNNVEGGYTKSFVSNKQMSINFPKNYSVQIKIKFNNDEELTQKSDHAKGDPENPMSEKEICDKTLDLVNSHIKNKNCNNLIEKILNTNIENDKSSIVCVTA